jgi:predicted AlkP superfamily phosphohydrolase/phosphomutase
MSLSDHGFTTLKQEVYLNRWLWENDYLKLSRPIPQSLHDIHPASKAYSLYPGRIFINLKGREKTGSVNPGREYEYLRKEIGEKLLNLSFPGTSQKVIKEIKYGEILYPGSITPAKDRADLFAIAHDGYDLKGSLWSKELFRKTVFNGMHSFDNAFLLVNGPDKIEDIISVADIESYILKALNAENTDS